MKSILVKFIRKCFNAALLLAVAVFLPCHVADARGVFNQRAEKSATLMSYIGGGKPPIIYGIGGNQTAPKLPVSGAAKSFQFKASNDIGGYEKPRPSLPSHFVPHLIFTS